jgi:hypothetical protein
MRSEILEMILYSKHLNNWNIFDTTLESLMRLSQSQILTSIDVRMLFRALHYIKNIWTFTTPRLKSN